MDSVEVALAAQREPGRRDGAVKLPFSVGLLRWVAAVVGLVLMAASADAAANNLRIATTGDYPPFSYVDDAGKLVGDAVRDD